MLNEKEVRQEVSYEEALAECIQYYVKRGYSEEHSRDYVSRGEEKVFRLYNIIQEEKKNPQVLATVVHLIWNGGGFLSGILAAGRWKIFGQNRIFD